MYEALVTMRGLQPREVSRCMLFVISAGAAATYTRVSGSKIHLFSYTASLSACLSITYSAGEVISFFSHRFIFKDALTRCMLARGTWPRNRRKTLGWKR